MTARKIIVKTDVPLVMEWLAALRSGEYPQGENQLKRDGKYCCLGVVTELAGGQCGGRVYLTKALAARLGMASYGVTTERLIVSNTRAAFSLADANDNGLPFPAIADIIERNLYTNEDGLFLELLEGAP